MNIRDYWQVAPSSREEIHDRVIAFQREQDAQRPGPGLVLYQGKYYEPRDVPCSCELIRADLCYKERKQGHHEYELCDCPCHEADEGDW